MPGSGESKQASLLKMRLVNEHAGVPRLGGQCARLAAVEAKSRAHLQQWQPATLHGDGSYLGSDGEVGAEGGWVKENGMYHIAVSGVGAFAVACPLGRHGHGD
ncbi:MAG: hypothetical protein M1822_009956 [Bathelium mastoideum]|nr:MAG: hypothetical protein M1822_009956 [Bathelium mastoideum]